MTADTARERIRPKERDAIVQSLRAGIVPRVGLRHLQVGRGEEVRALVGDIERITAGGSAIRFVLGDDGSGKTFLLNLVRSIALEKRLVTVHADLNPGRLFLATDGKARGLYAELMRNLATRARSEGGALTNVVERFLTQALAVARARDANAEAVIREQLSALSELVGGYDFAEVLVAYWRGHDTGNETLEADALRWLRGEFSTQADARRALGVCSIVDDAGFYDQLALMARFVRLAGYAGVLVCLDVQVNLHTLVDANARASDIVDDCLRGSPVGLGFFFGGTPGFLGDEVSPSRLAAKNLVEASASPVLRLANLTPEDLYILLTRLRRLYSVGLPTPPHLPDEALEGFMAHCSVHLGAAFCRDASQRGEGLHQPALGPRTEPPLGLEGAPRRTASIHGRPPGPLVAARSRRRGRRRRESMMNPLPTGADGGADISKGLFARAPAAWLLLLSLAGVRNSEEPLVDDPRSSR
ncbi:ATP-binding protein [Myxococcus sp. K15C18031901]|uniref:BREX system ATP-binding domain-containing protein n=1 Tax=Myxococcus dinghuensis TaxID=2906761 RepID=UPI0020A83583|nr:BREX system ATP-binding domain-containing protein [Myxococcus dinghuensis]MCP3105492.1 ATP-binding protein [Myxococcus dinghuensis]